MARCLYGWDRFSFALFVLAAAGVAGCGGGGGGSRRPPVFLSGNTFLASIQGKEVVYSGQGGMLSREALSATFAKRPDLTIAYDGGSLPPAISPVAQIRAGGAGVLILVFEPGVAFEKYFTPGDNKVTVTTSRGIHIYLEGKGPVEEARTDGSELRITFGTIEPGRTSFFAFRYANGQSQIDLVPTSDASLDADRDHYASAAKGGVDCDDANPAVHPDAVEIAGDGVDQNCDGLDAPDVDHDGYTARAAGGDDCDDQNPFVHPGAAEIWSNGIDDDCDGVDQRDDDGDGYVSTATGGDDCDDRNANVHPGAAEVPSNNVDEDCDGIDTKDDDGDGHLSVATGGDDCDDTDPATYPGATEVYGDGQDQNCDGWAPRGRILAIGDSMTAGVGDSSGGGYPAILGDILNTFVVNAGVAGEVAGDISARIEDEIDDSRPAIVIVLAGYNDVIHNVPDGETFGAIEDMIEEIRSRGLVAIVGNLHPTVGEHAYMNPGIQEFRADVSVIASQEGAILANTWTAFASQPSLGALLSSDGLHPNHEGYRVMAQAFAQAILNPSTPP